MSLRFVSFSLMLWAAVLLPGALVWGQCTSGCTFTATVPSAATLSANAGQTICLIGTGSFTGTINLNGGTLCVGPNVTYNAASRTYNGNWTINNFGNFAQTVGLNFNSGTTFNNQAGGTLSFNTSLSFNGVFTNAGTFNVTGNQSISFNGGSVTSLTGTSNLSRDVSNGGTLTLGGTITNVRDFTNSGSLTVTTSLTASRNIINSGTIVGGVTSGCNYFGASNNFTNSGTIGGSGQGLLLGNAPGGTINSPAMAAGTPTNTISAPTIAQVGNNLVGSISYTQGSTQATHYLVVRRMNNAVNGASAPANGTNYTVGQTIGSGVVVAINPIATTTFTDVNALNNGCSQTYNYAAFVYRSSGSSCGYYNAAINNRAHTATSTPGTVTGGTTICSGATSGPLTLAGHNGSVIRWEFSVSPFTSWNTLAHTGTTYTSGALTETTQFRAVTNGGTGCANINSAATTVTVSALPVPTATNGSRCGTGSVTFAATPSTGETIDWYTAATGGTLLASGANSFLETISATTTRFAQARNTTTGCVSATRAAVVMTVNPLPGIAQFRDGNNCGSGNVAISAVPSGGATIDWYANPTGGSALLAGNTAYTATGLSATTTYYAEARVTATGCTATIRTGVRAIITALPSITAGGGGSFCVGASASLTSSGTGYAGVEWRGPNNYYSTAPNPTLSSLTTAMSGTYTATGYALSGANLVYNGNFELGNIGFTSSYSFRNTGSNTDLYPEATYAVVTNPAASHNLFAACVDRTSGTGRQMVVNGTSVAGVTVWSQTVNVDPNTDFQFSYWEQSVVGSNPSQLQLYINGVPAGGVYTAPITTCLWGQFFYNWNSGSATSAVLTLVNQSLATSGNDFALDDIVFQPICQRTSSVVVSVDAIPTATTVAGGGTQCGGSLTLTASGGTGGTMYFQGTTSGGTSTAIPSASQLITASGTYFFRSRSAGGCWGPEGSAAVTINTIPTANTVAGGGTQCGGSLTLTATGGTGGTMYFQGTTSGGTSTATASSSQSISTSGTYYFRSRSAAGCWGAEGSAVVTINAIPTTTTVAGAGTFCGSATLTATGGTGGTIYWQNTTSGGTSVATALSSQVVSTSGTYYFRSRSAAGCWGAQGSAAVTINAIPTATTVTGGGTQCGGSLTLTATGGTGGTMYFQGTTSGGTSTATASSSQSISTSGTYYFRSRSAAGCWGAEGSAVVIINAIPTATSVAGAGTFCGSTTLTATGGTGGTIYWQNTTSGGTSVATALSSQVVSTSGTYFFRAQSTAGCWGAQGSAAVTINAIPTATTVTGGGSRCGGSLTLTASGGTGGTMYFQGTTSGGTSTATAATSRSLSTSGIYYFRAQSAAGCWGPEGSARVTINPIPNSSWVINAINVCGTSTTVFASNGGSGTTYWQGTNATGTSTATPTNSFVVTTSGTYYFRARSDSGCWNTPASDNVFIFTPNDATISYSATPICHALGGSIAVNRTGTTGGTYSSGAGLNIDPTTGEINIAASTPGAYTVTYRMAANGLCSAVSRTTTIDLRSNVAAPTTPLGAASVCQASTPTLFTASAPNATSYTWNINGVGNSIAGTGTTGTATWSSGFTGTATVSVVANGCGGPTAAATRTVTVLPSGTWLGGTNSWVNPANWCGAMPTAVTDVFIPAGVSFQPRANGAATVRSLTINPGAAVTVATGHSLNIYGSLTNNGTFTIEPGSSIDFAGPSAQNIPAMDYANLATSGLGTKTFTGTTRISGTFTPSAATHVVAGSTLEFNGTAAQNIPAFTFNNLTTSGNSAKSLAGNVTVGGAMNLVNGTLTIGANTLTLNGTVLGAGTISCGGCSSTLNIGGTGNTGTLNFTPADNTLGRMGMVKTANGNVDLGNNLNICTQLMLNRGKVILGSSNLTLLPGASTTNGNDDSFVQTVNQLSPINAGFLIQQMPIGGGSRTFPVGTSTYTPAYLNNAGSTRNFKVRVFNDVYEHGIAGAVIQNISASVRKTWEIEPLAGAGTPDVSINLQWNAADEGAAFAAARANSALPYIGKNTGIGSSTWQMQAISAGNYTSAPFSITTPSITTFSKFAIGSTLTPLPVSMGDLSVISDAKTNKLTWDTYAEIDSKGFNILRSANGKDFVEVGYVAGAGNSTDKRTYSFVDRASTGRVYYKIRFVGIAEGDIAYSNIVTAAPGVLAEFRLYPNPAQDALFVDMDDAEAATLTLRITDAAGKIFSLDPQRTHLGTYRIDLTAVPAGLYVLEKIQQGAVVGKARVVKL